MARRKGRPISAEPQRRSILYPLSPTHSVGEPKFFHSLSARGHLRRSMENACRVDVYRFIVLTAERVD